MEKENLSDALLIRVVLVFLILTALTLKAISKFEMIFLQDKSLSRTGYSTNHLPGSGRQSSL